MNGESWKPVGWPQMIGFGIGMAAFIALVLSCERGFIFLVDHANLLFHEAGHPVVGLFGSRLEPYGGTIGQLVFPVVLAVSFWRKGETLSFAASAVWFFQNWWNIARYMADARALQLPLVGGGDHDWNTILDRWDILQYDTRIARWLEIGGWTGVALVCAWVVWRFVRDRGTEHGAKERF